MNNIKEKIKELQNDMVGNVWEYRKNILKELEWKEKSDILDECLDVDFDDEYCSMAWELGYIYAMKEILQELNK